MTADDFWMKGTCKATGSRPALSGTRSQLESDWAEMGRAGSLTPQDNHRAQTGVTERHTPKFTDFSQTSGLLPSWCRAHRFPPHTHTQNMSLSSHPKEIQLATPEPVANSHQTLLKENYPRNPPQTAPVFVPSPILPSSPASLGL